MRVYGIYYEYDRLIVAAKTKKAAYEAMRKVRPYLSRYAFDQYSSPTANEQEFQTAIAKPGVVFTRHINDRGGPFKEMLP